MKQGVMIASATLALFALAGCSGDDGGDETGSTSQELVKCQGINECAGTSECASADGNSCEGMNECKGQGWITVPAEQCAEEGGMVIEG